jgi:hypothetical protein
MTTIGPETAADLFFQINWSSGQAIHTEAFSGMSVNFWRDIMPRRLYDRLMGSQTGDQIQIQLSSKDLLPQNTSPGPVTIKRMQFDPARVMNEPLEPRFGRFYPKGVLKDMVGIYKVNVEPFRCVNINNGNLSVELGHPLSGKDVDVQVTAGSIRSKMMERGGTMRHWGEMITQGVGMQARWNGVPTDFFSDSPFRRDDESADTRFYERPRLVQHIDDTAIGMVQQIYARFIEKDMRVLDLMSSWQSHMPSSVALSQLTGLGLNETELKKNPDLSDYLVRDLNDRPGLPFLEGSYDAVVCNASIEYLIHPRKIFKEVARVLAPGGPFVVTFSNRWFAPKAIRLWRQLHEFERMGLVLEYFQLDGLFRDLHTYSVRGLERPLHDKYHGQIPFADPIYAVWGRRV